MPAQFAQNMAEVHFSNDLVLEACVETFEQAMRAEAAGAHRIELCGNLAVGGITPPKELIKKVLENAALPVMVMVRPRAGDFVFSENEMTEMRATIDFCKKIKVAGVVIGNLDAKNKVDVFQTKKLVAWAAPLEVTFHKAIDETPDLIESVKTLSQIAGIQRILTSGGAKTASGGAKKIREMIKTAGGNLTIISAGKITQGNLFEVHQKIGGTEYHGRRIV